MQVVYGQFGHPMPMLMYYGGPQHQHTYGVPMQSGHPQLPWAHYQPAHNLLAHPPYEGGPYTPTDARHPSNREATSPPAPPRN